VIEKLLENWLDSASERSYQAVFVQMLSAQRYRVVHSTRHAALEYGKDILAISPEGKGCAYQLKGNPRGKLGLAEFTKDIQPQLFQLMTQKIVFPGFPKVPHKAYLVTNGYFEEEVQRAVDDLNRMPYPSKVSLISRGHLFGWCKQFGASLWPSELDDVRSLLELFLSNPQEVLHTKLLSKLLQKILAIENHKAKLSSSAKFYRAVTSAALLTGIATSGYAEAENHFAIASAWILFAVTTIAAGEKHGYKLDRAAAESFKLAEQAIADALSELWNEVSSRKHLIQGASLPDPEIYGWRYVTLLGLLSCLAILDDSRPCLLEDARTKLQNWLTQPLTRIDLWGEGAVAALVPWLVWLRKHDATIRPDREIHGLAKAVITRNQRDSESPLANPYYNFEEIARFKLHLDKAGEASSVGRETFVGSSFTAEPLLHLLVRTNLKQACKTLWPDFTKISHRICVLNNRWEYGTLHIASGWDETKIYPSTYKWSDLKTEAIHRRNHKIPTELAARPWLLGLWWQVAPHRYTTPSNRVFVESVLPGWGG
jgi:hypothetical protein